MYVLLFGIMIMNLFDYCRLHQLFYFIVAFYQSTRLNKLSDQDRVFHSFGAILDETTG